MTRDQAQSNHEERNEPMPEYAPAISVIVPVFNTDAYLRQCMDSLVAQTFRDFEVIVVDDGSTDDSPNVVAEYAERFDWVSIITKPNGGLGDARNAGIGAAHGEYLSFVDGDDYVSPYMLEHAYGRAVATDADVVVFQMMGFDSETGREFPYTEGPLDLYGASLAEQPALLVSASPSVCNKLFRRRLFTDHEMEFPVRMTFEDLATTCCLFAFANRIEKVEEFLYFYRRARSGSITSTFGAHYEHLIDALEIIYRRLAADDLVEKFRGPLLELTIVQLVLGRFADFFPYGDRPAKLAYVDRVFEHLNRHFPGWTRDPLVKRVYATWWRHAIGTHRVLLKVYASLPSKVGLSLSWHLHMFWDGRSRLG